MSTHHTGLKGLALAIALVLGLLGAAPAYAITGGQPDGWDHPQVGLIYYEVGDEAGLCSGTLIAPTVVLTAAHCTYGLYEIGVTELLVTFDTVVTSDTLFYSSLEWSWHPDYDPGMWPFTYDVGLVFLTEEVNVGALGELPDAGMLETLIPARGASKQIFTDVGYGQAGVETGGGERPRAAFPFERRQSFQNYHPGGNAWIGTPHGYDDLTLMLKSNPSSQHGSGCGGDSGGPIFLGDSATIIAIHTGGYNLGVDETICGRVASLNHRIDTQIVLEWLWQFV